jgi:membrane protease YdiL (CAAX protease family)
VRYLGAGSVPNIDMAMTSKARDLTVLGFALLFPLAMAWLYFVVLAEPNAADNRAVQFAFAAGKIVQALLPIVYVWWTEPGRVAVSRPSWRGIGLGAGFAAFVALGVFGLYFGWLKHSPLLGDAPERVFQKVREFNLARPLGYLLMALFISLVHSLFEEYYWRWFVFGGFKRHVPVSAALVLSALGFTLHHVVILGVYFPDQFWTLAVPFSLCVGFGGGVWAWIYHKSGSLYAAWASHALIDAAILAVGYDMIASYFMGP